MSELKYNKVVLGDGTVVIDLTGDDVIASNVQKDIKFHGRDGKQYTGTSTYDADTKDATATASQLIEGATAYVNGNKITGTMVNRGGVNATITNATTPYSIPVGFHDGSGKVNVDTTALIAGNIKKDVNVLGVVGTYEGEAAKLQSKSVDPSFEAITVFPDTQYDALSSVIVNPIPTSELENEFGGITLTIG